MIRREINVADLERAMNLGKRDARARALAISCVAEAMREDPPTDVPPEARRYAHDVATLATALLVSLIYIEDTELRALKEERDRYRELALTASSTRLPSMFVPGKGQKE